MNKVRPEPVGRCSSLILKPYLLMYLIDFQLQPISHGDEQRLAQAQRCAQGAKGEGAAFVDQQYCVGAFGQRGEVAVGDDQGLGLIVLGNTQAVLGFFAIGGEADGDDQVVGAQDRKSVV